MTARTRCQWVTFMGRCELLYIKGFSIKLKGAVYKSYVRPTILHEREEWCLR